MPSFLTVKEAARQTGRSPSSIRRLIYPLIHDDSHPERAQVQPGVEEALALRTKGESFAWLVSEEFLQRAVPADSAPEKGTDASAPRAASAVDAELVGMLRRELEIKNQQITQYTEANTKLMDTIHSLTERLREGNILMGSLQQHLKLGDGRPRTPAEAVKAKRAPSAKPEKGSTIAAKTPSKPKRGLLRRLFGG